MKKKVLALLMAAALTLGICVPAFGDEDSYTLTLTNAQPGHTYTAYQIFGGDLHVKDGETILSNVVWGSGVTEDGKTHFGDAAKKAEALETGGASAAESFAAELASYLNTPAGSATISNGATQGSISGLPAGYYLVKTTGVTATDGVYTYYIMKVVKDTEAKIKADVPSVDKTVNDDDANIGDTVTFTLTATMPNTLAGYETYKVVFHDTLSNGLAYAGNLKVSIDGTDKTNAFTPSCEEGLLRVSCNDVKALGAKESSKIVVTYDAVLDDDAVIGTDGNSNKVYLEYSNDPNWDGKGGTEPTGNTPEKEVKVFTWEIPVVKVDGSDPSKKLAGAKFTLFKDAGCSQHVNVVEPSEGTVYKVCTQESCTDHTHVFEIVTDSTGEFEIEGLQQGTYYLKEIEAPAGYNLLAKAIKVVVGENGALTVDGSSNTVAEVTVENNKGPVLPETGGIGTTLFYVVGGALVIGAAVLLVVRRRAAGSEE